MPDLTADEVVTQKHKRNFVQYGGAKPGNKVQFAGQDAQYMSINGVSVPELGGIDPIWVHDVRQGRYRLVGRSYSPADLAKATLVILEKHGGIPRQLLKSCPFNLYELTGKCSNLMDFTGGWSDYALIYSGAVVTDKDLGDRTSWDSDDKTEDSLSIVLSDVYPIGQLSFGEGGKAQIDREVVDVVFGNARPCDDCANGSERIYYLVQSSGAGSPGLPAEIVYSLDSGQTWNQTTINGAGATETVYGIDIVGNNLVVIGGTAGNLYYAEINSNTGALSTFTTVNAFTGGATIRDLYVVSPNEVWFVGNSGVIYKSTDITAGATLVNNGEATSQNLYRITGAGIALIATGANGAIVKSVNRGTTWGTTITSPVTTLTIQAVAMLDEQRYWVGTDFPAYIYYTMDGGETWTEYAFSGAHAGAVQDIVFATNEVGYFLHSTATPTARIFSTWDGGADWSRTSPRILNWPVFNKGNRIAIPKADTAGYLANTLAVAGLAGNGLDGIALIGTASKI
jgi:photosystem II stability/assembly factor-like uncharacterized protein